MILIYEREQLTLLSCSLSCKVRLLSLNWDPRIIAPRARHFKFLMPLEACLCSPNFSSLNFYLLGGQLNMFQN